MQLPQTLTTCDSKYFLDGGTTILEAIDNTGCERSLMLVQHRFPTPSDGLELLPGRLYFSGELIEMRSEEESQLLHLLRTAEFQVKAPKDTSGTTIEIASDAIVFGDDIKDVLTRSPVDNLRALAEKIVQYVESEAYLKFSYRVAQAIDPNRYTVWIDWQPDNRNRVLVRLARVLGTGLPGATEFLDNETALATNATALEVGEIAAPYVAAGLTLRAEPPFPCPLG